MTGLSLRDTTSREATMTPTDAGRPRLLHRAVYVVGVGTMTLLALLGLDAVAYSATGGSLILGQVNLAGTTTTLKNTGTGPTLSLISQDNQTPTLKVSSTARVPKLNS